MNNRILVFGDSITWGAWDSKGGWATRLKSYTDNQAMEGKEGYDEVYPLGISGENSDGLLDRFEVELKSRLYEESDIQIVIAIGVNDSRYEVTNNENWVSLERFKQNLEKIVEIAREDADKIILVGLTPVDDSLLNPMPWDPDYGYSNKYLKKYDQALKKFATEKKLEFVDLYGLFEQREYKKLLSDGLHPNDEGHGLIYKQVLEKLLQQKIVE